MADQEFIELFQQTKIVRQPHSVSNKSKIIRAELLDNTINESKNELDHHAESPKIKLIKRGGRVESIIVTCSCGNELQLALQYSDSETMKEPDN